MYKPESVKENETYKILRNSKIQMDHPIPTRRPKQMLINKKKNYHLEDFALSADHRVKMKESEKIGNY